MTGNVLSPAAPREARAGTAVSSAARRGWMVAGGLAACLALGAGLALPGLGDRPLLEGEARYALVGREMLASGDWIQPRLNSVRYYEKPPMLYWAIAAAQSVCGRNELASRLPVALAHVGTVGVVYLLGLTLGGPAVALRAGLVYATAVGPFIFARAAFPDGLLTFFLAVALLGLVLAAMGRAPRLGSTLLWGAAACAGLTKGLLGIVVPFGVAALYTLLVDRSLPRRLRWGPVLFLLLFLPWHLLLAWRDPAFVPFYLLNEHVYRFLNIREPIDYTPMSIPGFWIAAVFWFLPWSLFLPAALARGRVAPRPLVVPLLWAALVMVFFTLAQSRLEKYSLPAFPALAVVVAAWWPGAATAGQPARALLVPAGALLASGLALAAAGLALPAGGGALAALLPQLDGYYREHPEAARLLAAEATGLLRPFSLVVVATGLAAVAAARGRRPGPAFAAWAAGFALVLPFVSRGMDLLGDDRSQRAAMEVVRRHWEPGAELIVDGIYEQTMSVSFYADRPVAVLAEGEHADLLFGRRQGDAPDLFLRHSDLAERWDGPRRIFLVTAPRRYPPGAVVLVEHPNYAVVTNCPLDAPHPAAPPP